MLSSALSSSGKKPTPTMPTAGTVLRPNPAIAIATTTLASRRYHGRNRTNAKTAIATASSTTPSPVRPFTGSTNEPKNVPIAITTTGSRWSSAHAMTCR